MKKSLKIAVTGGIGSGKSTALSIISKMGYKTVSLDAVYAELLSNEDFVMKICDEMGVLPIIIDGKKHINREEISKKVFSDKNLLKKLNDLTHSAIFQKAFSYYDSGIVFYEVPLLFEGGYEKLFDFVLVIIRDKNERIESVKLRDNLSEDSVNAKINNQVDYDNLDLSLHILIKNNSSVANLEEQLKGAIANFERYND